MIATPAMNAGSRNAHGWNGASDAVAFASSENSTWLLGNGYQDTIVPHDRAEKNAHVMDSSYRIG